MIDDILDEIRRLAVDGHAPSSKRYDRQRRDGLPSSRHLYRIGTTWSDAIEQAGLLPARRRRRKAAEATQAALIFDLSDADGLAVLEQTQRVTTKRC